MDDYLESLDSVDEAKTRIREVEKINSHAGFLMHEWVSNSEQIGKRSNATNLQTVGTDKALGRQWDTKRDVLSFAIQIEKILGFGAKIRESPTKRLVLKVVMSIYDPLGLLGSYTVRAKILLQTI